MKLHDPARHQRVVAAAGRVAVLMGGSSAEREVSLRSGAAVAAALRQAGVDARAVDWDGTLANSSFSNDGFDRFFIALHGRGGEDGQIQSVLDLLGRPYTGSGVLGCALAMDKIRTKLAWRGAGLPTPAFERVALDCDPATAGRSLGLPVFVKPAREGSSIGISKVELTDDLGSAVELARRYDDEVLIERAVRGGEYTMAIVDGQPLPIIKLETPRSFYDFEAKYTSDDTRYICPCGLAAPTADLVTAVGMRAFEAIGLRGWGRVDFMVDDDGQPWLIEINTVPGMTDHSLVPMAARHAGIDFPELVVAILGASMPEFRRP